MICVDSSVWIAAQRGQDPQARLHLVHLLRRNLVLLPVIVRLEILAGAALASQPRWALSLHALTKAEPTSATWQRIETWLLKATAAGQRFALADLLIAALAADHDAAVWSLDRAFADMAALGWIKLYELP